MGGVLLEGVSGAISRQAEAECAAWGQMVERELANISLVGRRLPADGNSQALVQRFKQTQAKVKVVTRLEHGIRFLESLEARELVFNGNIRELLKTRHQEEQAERQRQAELELLKSQFIGAAIGPALFTDRGSLALALRDYPEPLRAIEGALDAYAGNAVDKYRHVVTGARVALEGVAIKVTGQQDWKVAVRGVADDETGRLFAQVYRFLSSRGPHAGRTPRKIDAEIAFQHALALISWLLGHLHLFAARSRSG